MSMKCLQRSHVSVTNVFISSDGVFVQRECFVLVALDA